MPCAESSWLRVGATVIACLAVAVVLCARTATAETLNEALSNTYLINPVLNSERARLRSTDEQVSVAISGLRPNISASGDAAFRNQGSELAGGSRRNFQTCDVPTRATEPAFGAFFDATAAAASSPALPDDGVTHPRGYSVTLSQPIFEGFQNLNAIRQSKATVQAG